MKFLTIISFLTFLTWIKSGRNLALMSIKCGILATFALIFYSGVCTTTTFCFKMHSPCKISRNINNPKLEYCSSEKKLLKPLKITIFWPNLCKNGVPMSCTQQQGTIFFAIITKPNHKLSKNFYFIKIPYALAEFWMFFYFVWCYFAKKCHFQSYQRDGYISQL